jgi:small conductance mechanosensitive channel
MEIDVVGQIFDWFVEHGLAVLGTIFLAAMAYWLLGVVTKALSKRIQQLDNEEDSELDKRTKTIFRVVHSTGIVLILGTAVLMILTELGVSVTPVLASVGFVGLALGLGAQTLVGDIISGLFILIENQYTVGDAIEINGVAGSVEEMTLRATMVRDLYGTLHIVPNGEIRIVSNKSRDWSRAVIDVGITYDADVDTAVATLQEIGQQMMLDAVISPMLLEMPVVTGVEGLDDWAVRLRIMVKTTPGEQWAVQRHLRRQIRLVFEEANIEIAFPRQDVLVVSSS